MSAATDMPARTLAQFAALAGGVLHGEDRPYAAVNSDSRGLSAGDLFVALRGPRFDGNEFVAAARAAGAAGALVERHDGSALPQIVVDDALAALTRAAAGWRASYPGVVVAVAGSNGKTTVKEMIAAILARRGPTLATRGNLNNHIGVPLTLLRLAPEQLHAVVEVGANHPGEVAALTALVRPDVAIITNAGAEHLEGFGSIEGVARAEGELFAGIEPQATAIINADDEFASLWSEMSRGKPVRFGLGAAAEYSATDIRHDVGADGFVTRFALISPAGRTSVELRLAGMHNLQNAIGAAAAAVAAGATLEHVREGLGTMRAVAGRLQFKTARGAWIIDDSYNANPSSMRAAIDVLATLPGHRWLVVGDMAELGDYARSSHIELGRHARARGIERLFATGELAALAVEEFGSGAEWFPDAAAIGRSLAPQLRTGVSILVKGSRMNRLERVVEQLVGGAEAEAHA
ncbi:MAG: UDP-N-acetylmuramoyl-tripeptide--D-alanyl-D-alanine ligase [Steroidobacteraceae bacterium]